MNIDGAYREVSKLRVVITAATKKDQTYGDQGYGFEGPDGSPQK